MEGDTSFEEFAHDPDQEAGATDADQDAGDPVCGFHTDEAAQPAAQSTAGETKDDVADQAALAVHDLSG